LAFSEIAGHTGYFALYKSIIAININIAALCLCDIGCKCNLVCSVSCRSSLYSRTDISGQMLWMTQVRL